MGFRSETILVALLSVTLHACVHSDRTRDTEKEKKAASFSWSAQMQALSLSISHLLPYVVSEARFNDPRNQQAVRTHARTLAALVHDLDHKTMPPDSDPALRYVSHRFSQESQEAVRQLELGNSSLARHLLNRTTSYCIGCHTRNSRGGENLGFQMFAPLRQFPPVERTQFLVAVRDYDLAFEAFDQAVHSDRAVLLDAGALQSAAEMVLAVAIRVKNDPHLADEMVSRVIDSDWAPIYLKIYARDWKQAIQDWVKEDKSRTKFSRAEQMAVAQKLLRRSWERAARVPHSRAGLVEKLRASRHLHDLLALGPARDGDPVYAEALYAAGLATEDLGALSLGGMQDVYYEACIRHRPYSATAQSCYLRLEAHQLALYSNYGGNELPEFLRARLAELKRLAHRGAKPWNVIGR